MERKKIKFWELEKGIKLKNLVGFTGEKNKIRNNRYTEKQFRNGAINCEVICKTEKGLNFLLNK